MAVRKKKRVMSAAQKAALAKGRKRLSSLRSKKPATKRKPAKKRTVRKSAVLTTTTKTGVPQMATRRKTTRRPARRVKAVARRTTRRAKSFLGKSGTMELLRESTIAIGGGVAAGMLANKLPITNGKLKAVAPIVAGIVLAGTIGKKSALAKNFAAGMVVLGGVSIIKQLVPSIPMLAGESEVLYVPQYQNGQLGYAGESVDVNDLSAMGETTELGEEYYSPADM